MRKEDPKIAAAVDDVLDSVDFTPPIELADIEAVHAALRAGLPADVRLESYHRHKDAVFEVRRGSDLLCRRVKETV